MKALRKTRPERGADLIDLPMPTVGPNDVLVRIKAAAICGSDIHIYGWNEWAAQRVHPPLTFGHEACGEVVEVGERVTHLKPGDLVAMETHVPCGHCYQCDTGNQHACESMKILGVHVEGCFSEYAAVPSVCAWKLPKDMDPELGALLEPMGVGVHGLLVDPLEVGSVAIIGCGPIGIMTAQVAATLGAHPLFVLDVNEERLAMALRIVPGAIGVNPAKCDAVATLKEMNGGRGIDLAVELSGSVPGIRQAFDMIRVGGQIRLVGLTGAPVTLNVTDDVIYREATIKGTTGRLMWKTWHQMERLLATKKFDPRQVVTHRFKMDDYVDAFELALSGKAGKILLFP
ncbi:MAG: alcohol dehydrogenase catalytic domain-containing protein [Sphingomonadaceae bacterium]